MRFSKWHGAGNAYLVIEAEALPDPTPERVRRICHGELGAGGDGLLVLAPSQRADAAVRIFNPDGSEAEFSGNASRIALGYLAARSGRRELRLETARGVVSGSVAGESVTIEAGRAALEGPDHRPDGGPPPAERYTFVSIGNPHCVIEVEDPEPLDLAAVGRPIERHAWFPNRTNVEFYRPMSEHEIRMRVWERGAGETLSSGSGSSAAAVAAVVNGRARSPVTVHLDGGELEADVDKALHVDLTGWAVPIYRGELSEELVSELNGDA
jgi:diaminopimelate epimerase